MLQILKEPWIRNQEAWLPGLALLLTCGLGQNDTLLWASCFSHVTWVNQLLAYAHRISVRLKITKVNKLWKWQCNCKDVRDDCCCTELDPNRQQLWVHALVINGSMKDFIHFLLPYQGLSPGKDLGTGKAEPILGLLPTPLCWRFGVLCWESGARAPDPILPQTSCVPWTPLSLSAPWLALKFWCHIISLNAGSWISSGIWGKREIGKNAY